METTTILALVADLRSTAETLMADAASSASSDVNSAGSSPGINIEAARKGSRALARIKSLNAKTFLALESAREAVTKENAQSDAHSLGLENLLYEKTAAAKEVAFCRELPTPELDKVPLTPLEELPADAVLESDGLPVVVPDDEHETFKRRLKFELQERKRLEKVLEQKRKELAALREANLTKRRFVDALPAQIKTLQTTLQGLCQPMFGDLSGGSSSSSSSSAGSSEEAATSSSSATAALAGSKRKGSVATSLPFIPPSKRQNTGAAGGASTGIGAAGAAGASAAGNA